MENALEKLKGQLRMLFQFDCADLDFGIYRIMNYKREVIERFVEKDLIEAVSAELNSGILAQQSRVAAELQQVAQQIRESLGEDALDGDGRLAEAFHNTPLGRQYLDLQARAAGVKDLASLEKSIFNHLYTFFSRYYDNGDFMSKRRYSKQEKYAIPYNGEEVYLYWANSDQYYVKTAEYFRDYRFQAPNGVAVHFKLKEAQLEKDNNKGDKRFFFPRPGEASFDPQAREIVIPFEFRPLTEQEKVKYGTRNHVQDAIIAEALKEILGHFEKNYDALAALTAERHRTADGKSVSYLEHHLRQYTRRNTSDFFIHKDLKGFLTRELDFYLKNEVLNLDELEAAGETRAEGWFQVMRVIRAIGLRIITFLAQIEDFQKKLFEKRKSITETQYCITVGNIREEFYKEIAANDAQWAEWKELFHIDEEEQNLFTVPLKTREEKRVAFLKAHPTLVLDTKYFDGDFVDRLLASFEDLDGQTDGLLVHGENFQALNLLLEKYREKVKCIYIDPPYNTAASEIIYKNDYKHSSWLSMIENRIVLGKLLLQKHGVQVVAIDEVEQEVLGLLLKRYFPEHQKTCVTIVSNPSGQQGNNFSYCHDYAYFVYPSGSGRFIGLRVRTDNPDIRPLRDVSKGNHLREDAANCFYPILIKDGEIIGFGDVCDDSFHPGSANIHRADGVIEVYPIDAQGNERKWVWARDTVETIRDELRVVYNRNRGIWDIIRCKTEFNYTTVWSDKRYSANSYGSRLLNNIIGSQKFSFPKSIYTVMDCIQAASGDDCNALVLDYFAGSGTTGHAVINLNREDGGCRKFILVEMDNYFDTVLLPRIKKVTFAPEWRDGRPVRLPTPEEAARSPRIIKYIRLESYDDALNNISFTSSAGQQVLEFDDYLLKYMLDWETKESETFLNVQKLARPFSYELILTEGQETKKKRVDIPETFNFLLGLHVLRREVYQDGDRRYVVYRGTLENKRVVVIWRETKGWGREDYERDKKFVAEQKLTEEAGEVFVNGDSFIPGARSLDPIFKSRMFGGV